MITEEGEPMDVDVTVEGDQRTFTPSADSDTESYYSDLDDMDMDTGSYKPSLRDPDSSKCGLAFDRIKEMIKDLWISKRHWDLEVRTTDASFQAHTSVLTGNVAIEILLENVHTN